MNEIKMPAHINSARTAAARTLLALGLSGVMALPAMATSVGTSPVPSVQAVKGTQPQNGQTQNNQSNQGQPGRDDRAQGQQAAPTPLKVTYYTADPSKGGKVITTLTLTRPARPQDRTASQATVPAPGKTQPQTGNQTQGSQTRPVNPIVAQAPAGATFAVIQGGRGGERVIDLAQADQMRGPGMGGPGGGDGGPRGMGPDGAGNGQNDRNDQGPPPRN
jgi:hypothetical protein